MDRNKNNGSHNQSYINPLLLPSISPVCSLKFIVIYLQEKMYVKYKKPDFLSCFVQTKKIRNTQRQQRDVEEIQRSNRYGNNSNKNSIKVNLNSRILDLSIDIERSNKNLKKQRAADLGLLGDKVEMKSNLKRLVNFENIIDQLSNQNISVKDSFYRSMAPRFKYDMWYQNKNNQTPKLANTTFVLDQSFNVLSNGRASFATPKYNGLKFEKYLSKSLGGAMGKQKISTPLFNNKKRALQKDKDEEVRIQEEKSSFDRTLYNLSPDLEIMEKKQQVLMETPFKNTSQSFNPNNYGNIIMNPPVK
ncbi:UNKNOWN [Stylonychia lemnae]|uniref:Uncharacterized protein n=1 Tax=Stylonychia lemnae TaxID=5949 RepID=A0A078ALK2_STYLE|nr:UNKNOWN [Stylonychia lemnae]|eukprot:CDW82751.1 UNKNOWN [Stylonychia lemnae]